MTKKNDFNPIVRKLTRREQLQQDVSQSSSFINGMKDASHTPERLAAYIDQLPKEKVLLFLKLLIAPYLVEDVKTTLSSGLYNNYQSQIYVRITLCDVFEV